MKNLEILLVDDGSTDASGEICDRYGAADPRIRVLHQENRGLVSARQTGIRMSAGRYIAFADSDDWVESNMYESLYRKACEQDAEAVIEGMKEEIRGESREKKNLMPEGVYCSKEKEEFFRSGMISCEDFFCAGVQPYLWNKLFKRELVIKHMFDIDPGIKVGEDAAAVYPMLAMADRKVVSGECHYHYCIRENSMMASFDDTGRERGNAALVDKALREAFEKQGVLHLVEEQLKRYMVCNILTRAYAIPAGFYAEGLFPFRDVRQGNTLVIYGAGAFGRAVHSYISTMGKWKLKAWIDADAARYRKLGMSVQTLEEIKISKEDIIIIAILRRSTKEAVERQLICSGVQKEQIRWIEGLADPAVESMWRQEVMRGIL